MSQIWFGIAPICEARWNALRLNDRGNIEEALANIQLVIDIFDYLRTPEIQGKLRHIYNKMWAEIDVFQDACNAVRERRGEAIPAWNLTRLWEEYNRSALLTGQHAHQLTLIDAISNICLAKPVAGPSCTSKPSTTSGKLTSCLLYNQGAL
jgi:hypothetical protein